MAITAAPGYIVDPNNPNAVIKDPGTSTALGGMAGGTATYGATNMQPIASQPSNPTPLPTTPPAPAPQPMQTTQPTAQPTAQPQAGGLTMPATGSVVDLLNMAGQDSSYQARQQLAQQYGIQGYTGTAAQNQELSKKFIEAHNKLKSTPAPISGAQASSALDSYFQESGGVEKDPERSFFDEYMSLNPVVKQMYDQINKELSSTNTQTTLREEYDKLLTEQGVMGIRTELMDVNRIMEGTEDDIRDEITNAGGFATESQVQALKVARNKTLLRQANSLTQQLALKEDYIKQLMDFTKLDREQVEKQVDRKLGLTEKLATIQQQITTAAKENYQGIIDKVGFDGFAELFSGDVRGMKRAEEVLGLPNGALSNENFLKSTVAKGAPASVQEYEYAVKNGYSGTFSQYQNEDANRKIAIARAGVGPTGLTTQQYNALNQVTTRFQADPIINQAVKGSTAITIADQIISDPKSATNQLKALYLLVKNLDPDSAVREGELALANQTQSYWQQFQNTLARANEGRVIAPAAAEELAKATKELMVAWNATAQKREQQYQSQAVTLGIGNEFGSYVEGSELGYRSDDGSYPEGAETVINGHRYVSDGTQWVLAD